ncbi:MAG: hypothetical protein JXB62_10200 [Pirellulales bacterium]|nr:hypothetical protein [Pirellulales bacterium]
MLDPSHPLAELLRKDDRFAFEAYVFVFEALSYAQQVLGLGEEVTSETPAEPESESESEDEPVAERHVSGQQLCEAIRRFALEQYGYMAKTVLNNWGVHNTGDFGEIVFSLIRIGQMRKTPSDCREDFDDVFDFDTAFKQDFKIAPPE